MTLLGSQWIILGSAMSLANARGWDGLYLAKAWIIEAEGADENVSSKCSFFSLSCLRLILIHRFPL